MSGKNGGCGVKSTLSGRFIDQTEADGVCVPIALAWKDRRAAAITIVWASPDEEKHPR